MSSSLSHRVINSLSDSISSSNIVSPSHVLHTSHIVGVCRFIFHPLLTATLHADALHLRSFWNLASAVFANPLICLPSSLSLQQVVPLTHSLYSMPRSRAQSRQRARPAIVPLILRILSIFEKWPSTLLVPQSSQMRSMLSFSSPNARHTDASLKSV